MRMQGAAQGRVRSWLVRSHCILVGIANNRWCGNIGRQHRSNGIFVVADLEAGVWYQRCHDPSCHDYRSPAMPLPADVWRDACSTWRCDANHAQPPAAGQRVSTLDPGGGCLLELTDAEWQWIRRVEEEHTVLASVTHQTLTEPSDWDCMAVL